MRSASGVNLVSAVLQSSLSKAQRRFNLSNPQSLSKRKLLKERKLEQKFQRKLKTLSKENRVLSSTRTELFQPSQFDWSHQGFQAHKLEFEEANDDQYNSFIAQLKAKYTCLNPRSSTSKGTQNVSALKDTEKPVEKAKKKGLKVKKLKKLLKKRQGTLQLLTKEKEKTGNSDTDILLEEKDDDADSGVNLDIEPPKKNTLSLLQKLRQKRLEARKERKRQKREAAAKKSGEVKSLASKANTMKETEPSSPAPAPASPLKSTSNYTIEGNITLFTNGKIQLTPETKANKIPLVIEDNKFVSPEPKKTGPQLPDPKHILYPREKVIAGWTKKHPTGCGFINLGNSCYMNATLQALFHTPAFVNWLLSDDEHSKNCRGNSQSFQQCLVCSMQSTLKESMRQNQCMRPILIHNKLKMICKTFSHGRQEDAHEFLRMLLEAMEKGYLAAISATRIDSRSKETTPLGQIFGGYIRTEVTCHKCNYISTTFQPLAELQLDIRNCTTLDDAIACHFRKEKLDNNDYKCEKCRNVSQATKQFNIEMAPIVLCLQLKRFTLFGGKICKQVHCNRYLDLTRFQHASSRGRGSLKYRMVGLVTHIGSSPNCGHYTAIAEASNKCFYQFDDSSVRQVSLSSALNTDAYVIIYELEKNGDKSPSSPSQLTMQKPMIQNGFPKSSTVTSASMKSNGENRFGSPGQSVSPKPIVNPLLNKELTPSRPKFGNPFIINSAAKATESKLVSPSTATRPSSLVSTSSSNERPKISFNLSSNSTLGFNANKLLVKPKVATVPVAAQYLAPRSKLEIIKSPLSATPRSSDSGEKRVPIREAGAEKNSVAPVRLFSATPARPPSSLSPKRINGAATLKNSLVPYDDEDDEDKGYGSQTPTGKEKNCDASRGSRSPSVCSKLAGLFAPTPIKTWQGTESNLTAVVNSDRKRVLEKTEDDLYDEEVDLGKTKKIRKDESRETQHQQTFLHGSPSKSNGNAFDKHEVKSRAADNERRHSFEHPSSSNGTNGSKQSLSDQRADRHSSNSYGGKNSNGFNNQNGFRRVSSTPNFSTPYRQQNQSHSNDYGNKHRSNNPHRGGGGGSSWKNNSEPRRFSNGGNGYHNNHHTNNNGYRRRF